MWSTDSVYVMIFLSGLFGGFGHCIGMCGPLVATYSVRTTLRGLGPQVLYNLGRITTYSVLGGVMGLTGSFAGVVRSIERFQDVTLAGIGAVMVLMGLSTIRSLSLLRRGTARTGAERPRRENRVSFDSSRCSFVSGRLSAVVDRIAGVAVETKNAGAFFPAGLVLGFIPCGLLYTALIAAAGEGAASASRAEGFLHGFLLLFLFGIGTAPALLLLGGIVSRKSEWLRARLYWASAGMMLLVGVLYIYRAVHW
jgi:sulfite exporter TauE/SafE